MKNARMSGDSARHPPARHPFFPQYPLFARRTAAPASRRRTLP
ncbi:hypothetical protein [Kamptonema formosum]|nr:hypothetical protein [Oscillatoria sp. PCC 10802]